MSRKAQAAKTQSDNVKVVVRCRPMNSTEREGKFERCVAVNPSDGTIVVTGEGEPKNFSYDLVFDSDSQQRDVYDLTARPIVDAVLQGFNGTIFAYGQTGTGKTFTMEGVRSDPNMRGIIPTSFEHVFGSIASSQGKQFLVRASYLELYMEEIRDLLSKDQKRTLQLKERPDTGIYVKDLSSFVVKSVKEIEHVMSVGNKNRSVGVTDMNAHSSRSHAIFVITVECSEPNEEGENHIRVGKLNLVDLAGSERQSKTHAEGIRLKEATKINLSLSCLGNVIYSLVDGQSTHVPYRDSQLTRLLQDSLGGNAKTIMIAAIGPASYNYDETINTLRFANRAKNIKNKPKINEDPKDALLREFQEELLRLKSQLDAKKVGKKERRKKRADGTDAGPDDGGEGDEEAAEDALAPRDDDALRAEQVALEHERQAMMQNQSMLAEEKERLLKSMQDREEAVALKLKDNAELAAKIAAMESKLLQGGGNVLKKTSEQEAALEERRRKIAEQQAKRQELEKRVREQEDLQSSLQGSFASLKDEVEMLTKKLKRKWGDLKLTKQEIADFHDETARDRDDLSQTIKELQRELDLRRLIVEHFIPAAQAEAVEKRAVFEEEADQWRMNPVEEQSEAELPASTVPGAPAVCEFSRLRARIDRNPRFRYENVIMVELDLPERTTQDYAGPTIAPRVQAALDAALKDEDVLELEAEPEDFLDQAMRRAKKADKAGAPRRPKTAAGPGAGAAAAASAGDGAGDAPTARASLLSRRHKR